MFVARELKPHGTTAAVQRHRRAGEPLCEPCKQAARDRKNADSERAREESAEAVRVAVQAAPPVDDVDPLEEALDNLRIVRAVLRDEGTPANTIASLTKRRDDLVDRIQRLRAAQAPVEVSRIDELTSRRRERRSAASG